MLSKSEIRKLIKSKQEGPYWDFKREWYAPSKKTDLLLDVLCMANNLENRDAYIIIGVDEENDYQIVDVKDDINRRNTQKITDFLRDVKFAGDCRPVVTVESLDIDGCVLDVIVIHNSNMTPFFLRESYKNVYLGNIYIRVQDSNTPKNKSADISYIEMLWKKRFGLLLAPMDKVKSYLQKPELWVRCPSDEDRHYYKHDPEYTIEYHSEDKGVRRGYEYYMFNQTDPTPHYGRIVICYNQTVLFDELGVYLDGARYFTIAPQMKWIRFKNFNLAYYYMTKGSINFLIHEFYYDRIGDEECIRRRYEECILIFYDNDEQLRFETYVIQNWHRSDEFSGKVRVPYMEQINGLDMNHFKKEYANMQILKLLLQEYRSDK